ncbi:MAG: hypothetical protein ACU83P_10720 [Gammaproteobacteria bacterium]
MGIAFTALAETAAPAKETPNPQPAAAAQEHGKHHKKTLDQLGDELDLNEKQKSKIKSLFKEKKQELKVLKEALKEEESNSPEEAEKGAKPPKK